MTRIMKASLAISAAVLAVGGIAYAQMPEGRAHMDSDGDGVVTKAEAQAAAPAMFARLDANKDGKLDKSDRDAHRAEMLGNRFAMLDTDKNGSISRDEFMAGHDHDGPGKRGDGPGMDGPGMDGPGMGGPGMDRPGMGGPGMGDHRGMRGGGPGGMMMKMADANNDGAVSQAEFTAAAGKHFDMVDADKDGRITKEERQAAHEKMKAGWQARKTDKSGPSN